VKGALYDKAQQGGDNDYKPFHIVSVKKNCATPNTDDAVSYSYILFKEP